MNPLLWGQLLLQKTPDSKLPPPPAACPDPVSSAGPPGSMGLREVLVDPWNTAGTVGEGQFPALSFTRSGAVGMDEPS